MKSAVMESVRQLHDLARQDGDRGYNRGRGGVRMIYRALHVEETISTREGSRRLALAVLARAVRDHRQSRNLEARRQLREWVGSEVGQFYCDICELSPERVQAAMRRQKRSKR